MNVVKRNGTTEPFNKDKLSKAVFKALERVSVKDATNVRLAIENVTENLVGASNPIPTTGVMQLVETNLMKVGLYDLAKEFILYREHNKPDIFRKRVAYKPFEYPQLADYSMAILNNFWLHTHYNYDSDIQDLKVNMPPEKAETAKRAILAISQVEVKVKKFWGNIGNYFPKPEIEEVGAVFASNEVVHARAYSNLLEIMNLNEEFEKLQEVPAIQKRIAYLERSITTPVDNKDVFKNIILFSMFIENVSLFSQFYLLLKLNKDNKWLKGTANAIMATSTEETLHAKFGFDLVNTIKAEHPEWWTDDVKLQVLELAQEAVDAECSIIKWIVGDDDDDLFYELVCFIYDRMNKGLKEVGVEGNFSHFKQGDYDFSWFDLLVSGTQATDFFASKSVAYSKGLQSFDEGSLF
jgi:ribonucleoside-diphosphate reductase beta chain